MNELNIGDTQLIFANNQLQIKTQGQDKVVATIPANELLVLHNFIGTLLTPGAQRQAFRLHREALEGLSATISVKGSEHPVTVHDLSITGLHFQIGKEQGVSLIASDTCMVNLIFKKERQSHRAEVRRKTETGYTVSFPNSLKGKEIDPPRELTNLVMTLQRRWLAKLAKLAQFSQDEQA